MPGPDELRNAEAEPSATLGIAGWRRNHVTADAAVSLLLLLVYALVFAGTVFFAVPTPLLPHHTHMAHLAESGAGMSTCKTFDQMAGDLKA